VVVGCRQVLGRDYGELFAPTALTGSFRVLVGIAAVGGRTLRCADVDTAFLNAPLDDELYVRPPPEAGTGSKVWLLRKALYGLKQAPRVWHEHLRSKLEKDRFTTPAQDPCVFVRTQGAERTAMLVHVDDVAVVGTTAGSQQAISDLKRHFKIKDQGEASVFLGLEVARNDKGIFLSQARYAQDILKGHGLWDAAAKPNPMTPGGTAKGLVELEELEATDKRRVEYQEMVGEILYLSTRTRPDLAYAAGRLSQAMSKPTAVDYQDAKRVLRYVKGTWDYGLFYPLEKGHSKSQVEVYADADYAGDKESRKSTTGMVVLFNGTPVMWLSKLQPVIATSTAEAEYIAAATAVKEGLWLRQLLGALQGKVEPVALYCDNQSAITLIQQRTAGTQGRTRHVDTQFHFVRERFMRGDITVGFVPSEDQRADIMTKPLVGASFAKARAALRLMSQHEFQGLGAGGVL
jgi:hypothetical protein